MNLVVISLDRYFSVTRPLTYRARRTSRRAFMMISGAWLLSALIWLPSVWAWPYFEGERTGIVIFHQNVFCIKTQYHNVCIFQFLIISATSKSYIPMSLCQSLQSSSHSIYLWLSWSVSMFVFGMRRWSGNGNSFTCKRARKPVPRDLIQGNEK